jgi:hypothetical protein
MNTTHKITQKKLILNALMNFKGVFNKSPDEKALNLYADLLSESFEIKQVTWALSNIIKKGSPFFPSCGEIFAELSPKHQTKEDLAPKIAVEVLNLIKEFSQYRELEMLEKASPDARLVFLALGSTQDIRLSENPETVRAQLERLAKSVLSSKEAGEKQKKLVKLGLIKNEEAGEMRRIDFGEFKNE